VVVASFFKGFRAWFEKSLLGGCFVFVGGGECLGLEGRHEGEGYSVPNVLGGGDMGGGV